MLYIPNFYNQNILYILPALGKKNLKKCTCYAFNLNDPCELWQPKKYRHYIIKYWLVYFTISAQGLRIIITIVSHLTYYFNKHLKIEVNLANSKIISVT